MKILTLGRFDYSRHLVAALARTGHEIVYGVTGTPMFELEPVDGLTELAIPRWEREDVISEAITEHSPDIILVGSAGYDGSNGVMTTLLDLETKVPIFRLYKEFLIRPSDVEDRALRGATGVIAGGRRNADYLRAVYGLDRDGVLAFDPDLVPRSLVVTGAQRLSTDDGAPHVVLGSTMRADGSEYDYRSLIEGLADRGVHVHVYSVGFSRWLAIGRALDLDSEEVRQAYQHLWDHDHVHLETPRFGAEQLREWSRYDAGLLGGRPSVFWPERTPFHNMNLPSRFSYYVGSGLPICIGDGALPALREVVAGRSMSIEYVDVDELAAVLHDRERMHELQRSVEDQADEFTIDRHLPELLDFVELRRR